MSARAAWLVAGVLACSGGPAAPSGPEAKAVVSSPSAEVATPVKPEPVVEPAKEPPAVESAEPPVPAEVVIKPSKQLEVEARLVEAKSAPPCGRVHAVVVMRYEVVRTISGSYPEGPLYVAHSCPQTGSTACKGDSRGRIKRFENGAVHHLKLELRRGSGALFDEFEDRSRPRYQVDCASLVTAAP